MGLVQLLTSTHIHTPITTHLALLIVLPLYIRTECYSTFFAGRKGIDRVHLLGHYKCVHSVFTQ